MATDDFVPTEHDAADPTQEPYAPRMLWHKPSDAAPASDHDEAPEDGVVAESDLTEPEGSGDEADAFGEPETLVVSEDLVFDEEPVFDEAPAANALPAKDALPEEEPAAEDEGEPEEAPADFTHVEASEVKEEDLPAAEGELEIDDLPELPATYAEHEAEDIRIIDDLDEEPAEDPLSAAEADAADDAAVEEGSAEAELFDATYDDAPDEEDEKLPAVSEDTRDDFADEDTEVVDAEDADLSVDEPVELEDLPDLDDEDVEAPEFHTTTIPVTDVDEDEDFASSEFLPEDVLEARDHDNPSTTAIRRDLMSAYDEEDENQTATWESALAASTEAAAKRPRRAALSGETPESLDDAIFEGATVVPVVPSRTSSHILSVFLGLIFIPLAWFFFADAGARMLYPGTGPADSGALDATALLEFISGIVALVVVLLLTLRSSLGAWVWGVVLTLVGIPWLVVPGMMRQYTDNFFIWMSNTGGVVGTNLANNIQRDAYSGRLLLLGLTLLGVAIVAVSVRRRGRAEEAVRARVEKVNPDGAHFTARERRRAAKGKK